MSVVQHEASIDLQERLIRRAWDDDQFAELLRVDPRKAIASETGVELPADVNIHVHHEDEETLHLVVPSKPQPAVTDAGRENSPQGYGHTKPPQVGCIPSWCGVCNTGGPVG